MRSLNETHDPQLTSWVESANRLGTDFPIQNLPLAVFRRHGSGEDFRGGVAIGNQVLDLRALHALRVLSGEASEAVEACAHSTLNEFMRLGPAAWSLLRKSLSTLLQADSPHASTLREALIAQVAVEYALPVKIGDFTDFYTSIHHATAVGRLFRPDNPLLRNYKWVPIAYHGRASSISISGREFQRPMGQILPPGADEPRVAASQRLDYELEVGIFIGKGNSPGERVSIEHAEEHVFGLCLLNDWSARDIQAWEYQPLGPFLAKNFATTISPWIVALEALAPFRLPWMRPPESPQPLPYLDCEALRSTGSIDVQLEAYLETARMRAANLTPQRLSRSSFRHAYWSPSQMVAHHTINGCNLQPGDLFGSGTQSGPEQQEAGSLLELTLGGTQPITLTSGEARTFLADGDRVIFRAWCESAGWVKIGFGELTGKVLPLQAEPIAQVACSSAARDS